MSIDIGGNILSADDVNTSGAVLNLAQYELPTSGLLFNLNAFNYTAGSTWYDNQQNIAMNLSGTAPPKTIVNNVPCVQWNNSGYFESSTANGQACDMTGEFTLVFINYATPPPSRRTIFEKIPNTYQSYEQELAVTWEVGNDMSYYTQYNAYDYASTQIQTANQWNLVAITINSTRTNGYYWKNGVWNSNFTSRSDTAPILANGIRLGSGYAGTVEVGYLHSCLIYGVSLNTTTMQQVHNYYSNLFSLLGATLYN